MQADPCRHLSVIEVRQPQCLSKGQVLDGERVLDAIAPRPALAAGFDGERPL
jgi:hypothetical protein